MSHPERQALSKEPGPFFWLITLSPFRVGVRPLCRQWPVHESLTLDMCTELASSSNSRIAQRHVTDWDTWGHWYGKTHNKMTFLTSPEKLVCQKVTISTNHPHTGKTRGGHRDNTHSHSILKITLLSRCPYNKRSRGANLYFILAPPITN